MPYRRSLTIESRLKDLVALVRTGDYSTSGLSEELGISVPTVSRCIRALRDRGYAIEAKRTEQGWCYRLTSEATPGQ
jgi:biotin operon repressor